MGVKLGLYSTQVVVKVEVELGNNRDNMNSNNITKQAGAELGQAQPKLGLNCK